MMKRRLFLLSVLLLFPVLIHAQDQDVNGENEFDKVSQSVQQQLQDSLDELRQLREEAAEQTIPLSRKLSQLEGKLTDVRQEFQETTHLLDSRTLDLNNLRNEIKSRNQETTYLSNLFSEYIRNFESRLHISEIQRYRKNLEEAKLANENSGLSQYEVFEKQSELLSDSLTRLEDALKGTQFTGTAVDPDGIVQPGSFVLVGPAAIFRSRDGKSVGTIEQRLGSLEPAIVEFKNSEDANAARGLVASGSGMFPLDPTFGNAHKIEKTEETLLEHVQKGGPVMYPIYGLAGAAFLVAFFKWLSMAFIRIPSQKRIRDLLEAVSEQNQEAALKKAESMGGPIGKMLTVGVEHLKEPRDLIEEVMYEKMLETRLRLNRFLSFIAISAASAPLLGLLGTVTGIINTFKLITVFGTGDVKTLSGGISEALITTEFGLIVAIPSLLIHAFLSRKARGVVDQMEKAAVALVNQISKTPLTKSDSDKNSDSQKKEISKKEPDKKKKTPEKKETPSKDKGVVKGPESQELPATS